MTLLDTSTTGGLPVDVGGAAGALVTGPGMLQYGELLLGSGTPAGWLELTGWRERPAVDLSDSPRPQAHGTYPGDVFAGSRVVTFKFMLRGTPADKLLALDALERYVPVDSTDRLLAVDDGSGPWFTLARTTALYVPQGKHFRHEPLECWVQFTCDDPRRYSLDAASGLVGAPVSNGGLIYPLTYPLDYGTSSSGSSTLTNEGSTTTPIVAVFSGPLATPILHTALWSMGFDLNLAAGETLVVDTKAGTVLLNGTADRLYAIRTDSDPLEQIGLPPGDTTVALVSDTGGGSVTITYHHARM